MLATFLPHIDLSMNNASRLTRLAPSPTGALHLGNLRTFLTTWLIARQRGWRLLLRIEDLDGPRVHPGAAQMAIDDLDWIGLDWDAGPIMQSNRLEKYRAAIRRLLQTGHAYPCICSRREAQRAASAPHAEDGANVYPGTCRDRFTNVEEAQRVSGRPPAIRFKVPIDGRVGFDDAFAGPRSFNVSRDLGDFVIAKADGTPAYQLAVVIDDAEMGVTDVVRGDDLLDSTPRQILLYRALGLAERIPQYTHLPLVIGQDDRRLAKRHGDTRLATYRAAGVAPARILHLMSRWLGMATCATVGEMIGRFDLQAVPGEPIVFDAAADRWLRE